MNTISFSVVHQISYTNNITEEAYNNYTLVIACLLELFIAGEMSHSITLYFVNFGENMKKHGKTWKACGHTIRKHVENHQKTWIMFRPK